MEQRQYTIYISYSIIASSATQSRCSVRECSLLFQTRLHIYIYLPIVYYIYLRCIIFHVRYVQPIKHVWARIKRQLRDRDTSSLSKLENAIHDLWKNLDRKYLKTLIDSIPKRLKEVISRKGKATSYQVIEYLTYLFTNCDIYGMTPQVLRNGIQFILI